mmetsp:Transcript_42915/g.121345  ORF Transcript_42915/g.121345 Transcript_42915/m.121345 type:complete len:603 (+) Transcript_42915:67-1875(+)
MSPVALCPNWAGGVFRNPPPGPANISFGRKRRRDADDGELTRCSRGGFLEPGIHWDVARRATSLGAYFRHRARGNSSIELPPGYVHQAAGSCGCFLHLQSGVLVRARPMFVGELAEDLVVLYLYTWRCEFDAISRSGGLSPLLENGSFGEGIYLNARAPDVFGSKEAILANSFIDDEELDVRWREIAHRRDAADYCIPVLVPSSCAVDVMRSATPAMQWGPGVDRFGRRAKPDRDLWVVGASDSFVEDAMDDGKFEGLRDTLVVLWGTGSLACRLPWPPPLDSRLPSRDCGCGRIWAAKVLISEAIGVPAERQRLRDLGGLALDDDTAELRAGVVVLSACPPELASGSAPQPRPTVGALSKHLLGTLHSERYPARPPSTIPEYASGEGVLVHLATGRALLRSPLQLGAHAGRMAAEEESFVVLYCEASRAEFQAALACGPSGAVSFELHAMLAERPGAAGEPRLLATSLAPDERPLPSLRAGSGEDPDMDVEANEFCIPIAVPLRLVGVPASDQLPLDSGDQSDWWSVGQGASLSDIDVEEMLCRLEEDGDWRIRRAALRALAACSAESAARAVSLGLEDDDGRVRALAASAAAAVTVMFGS